MTVHVGIKSWQTPYVQRKLIFRNKYIVILGGLQRILEKKYEYKLISTTGVDFIEVCS